MNAGGEESFIRVNISQPGDQRLIQQRGLYHPLGLLQSNRQFSRPDFQRLGAKPVIRGFGLAKPKDAPESAGVGEAELVVADVHHQMGMSGARGGPSLHRQTAGHPQMDIKPVAVVEFEDDFLAPAEDFLNRAIVQQSWQVQPGWLKDIEAVELDAVDPPASQPWLKGSHNGLNFG